MFHFTVECNWKCFFVTDSLWGSSVSVEYLNLALALLVYSVRYPALFWSTNKCIGMLFSFQLLINGLHTLLAYAGLSILYKVSTYLNDKFHFKTLLIIRVNYSLSLFLVFGFPTSIDRFRGCLHQFPLMNR